MTENEKTKKTPALRFKGFTDDWEQRKVSEITKFHKQGFYTTENYDSNKKYYLLRGTDITDNKLILKDTPKINATEADYQAFKTQVGDFLIVRSGTVGTYGIVYDDIPAIFGSYLIDFRFDMEQVTNEFFGYFYQSDSFKGQLRQIIQQSANTNINAENIKSTCIKLPSLDEQCAISKFFLSLDTLITLHQKKVSSLQIIKKSMLEKMFPKEGSKVPEIRFSGFTDDWEQRKLSDIADLIGGNAWKSKDYSTDGKYLVVTIANVSGAPYINEVGNKINAVNNSPFILSKDDILVSLTGNVGRVSKMSDIPAVLNQRVGKIIPKFCTTDRDFLFSLLHNSHFETAMIEAGQGAAQKNISNLDVLNYELCIPPERREQIQIGNFFSNLDNLITLHQKESDKLTIFKKSLLTEMFPK